MNTRTYRIALFLLALLGLAFALVTTFKYGAGVSSDAVRALDAVHPAAPVYRVIHRVILVVGRHGLEQIPRD